MKICSDRIAIIDDMGKLLTIGDKVIYTDIPFIGILNCDGSWFVRCKSNENGGLEGDIYIKPNKKLISA